MTGKQQHHWHWIINLCHINNNRWLWWWWRRIKQPATRHRFIINLIIRPLISSSKPIFYYYYYYMRIMNWHFGQLLSISIFFFGKWVLVVCGCFVLKFCFFVLWPYKFLHKLYFYKLAHLVRQNYGWKNSVLCCFGMVWCMCVWHEPPRQLNHSLAINGGYKVISSSIIFCCLQRTHHHHHCHHHHGWCFSAWCCW